MNMDKEVSVLFFPRLSLIFLFFFFPGITRLPVLEGEVSHVEIPRTSPSLGITIVGGADTPLVSNPFLIKFHTATTQLLYLFGLSKTMVFLVLPMTAALLL